MRPTHLALAAAALTWSACLAPGPGETHLASDPNAPPATPPEEPAETPPTPAPEDPPTPPQTPTPTGEGTVCQGLKLAPDAPLLLQTNSKNSVIHLADGTSVDITALLTDHVPTGTSLNHVSSASSAGYYGALAQWSKTWPVGSEEYGTEATLLTYDGDVVWRLSLPDFQWILHPDPQGRALIASTGGKSHRWVDASGQAVTLDDAFRGVLAGPRDGLALMKVYRDGAHKICWVDLDADAEFACVSDDASYRVIHDMLVRFDADLTAPTLHILKAGDSELQTLPLELTEAVLDYRLFQLTRSGLALVGTPYGEHLFRIDLATGEQTHIDPTLPEGWRKMSPCHENPQVGLREDGQLVIGLLDDANAASVFAFDPDTDTLEQLTIPVTGSGHLNIQAGEHGYTVQIEGWSSYYCFQPSQQDPDTSAPMETLRMYAPNDGSQVTEITPSWAPTEVHPSGLCALQRGNIDAFIDVVTGTKTTAEDAFGEAIWLSP